MATTKAPEITKVERSDNKKMTVTWKLKDKDHGDGQWFSWLWGTRGTSKDSTKSSGTQDNKKGDLRSLSKSFALGDYYPKTNKYLSFFQFRMQGDRKKYTEKKKTIDPTPSKTVKVTYEFHEPLTPKKITVTKDQTLEYRTVFAWEANVLDAGKMHNSPTTDTQRKEIAPYTDSEWETVLVVNSPTSVGDSYFSDDASKGRYGYAHSGTSSNKYSAAVTGSKTVDETNTSVIATAVANGNHCTRWFRCRTRGPAGPSPWKYAKRVYAASEQTNVDESSVKPTQTSTGGWNIYVDWTVSTQSGTHPIDQVIAYYVVTIPEADETTGALKLPSGTSDWQAASVQKDTAGRDGAWINIPSSVSIGRDKAVWIRVDTVYDGHSTEGNPILVTEIPFKLANPSFGNPGVDINEETHMVTVTATNNSQVENSFLAVTYKTTAHPDPVVVGIIGSDESSTQMQLDDWSQEGSKSFGIFAATGSWVQDSVYHRRLVNEVSQSDTVWKGGSVPQAPQNVKWELPYGLDGTIRISWDWTWEEANAVELSWADNKDAWESTNGPQTYVVDSMKPSHWNISGLTTGQKWYFRVRLIKIIGENAVYGAYSALDENTTVNLISMPDKPALNLDPLTITKTGTSIATWAYSSEDGTGQGAAEIAEVVESNGTTSYNVIHELCVQDNSQRIVIDPQQIDGWGDGDSAEQHKLVIRVMSTSGEISNEWSDPVTLNIVDKPVTSLVDIGNTLVYRGDVPVNPRTFIGDDVLFGGVDEEVGIASVEADIDPIITGEGTPSPTNIYQIEGYSAVVVHHSAGSSQASANYYCSLPELDSPVYSGHLNLTTGALTIDKGLLMFDGTENWRKDGDYMVLDLDGYDFVDNENMFADRYVHAKTGDNIFNITGTDNLVGYGVVGTMTVE